MRLAIELRHLIHKYFIWIIISSYLAAALFPSPGMAIRNVDLGAFEAGQDHDDSTVY